MGKKIKVNNASGWGKISKSIQLYTPCFLQKISRCKIFSAEIAQRIFCRKKNGKYFLLCRNDLKLSKERKVKNTFCSTSADEKNLNKLKEIFSAERKC